MIARSAAVALLDIEGTIAPLAYVHDVLFPYAREALASFLGRFWDRVDVRAAVAQMEVDAGGATLRDLAAVETHVRALMDRDVKATGLKQLQGLIWEEGFVSGALRSQVFADVPPALRRWRAAAVRTAVFSSGSIAAQKLFMRYSEHGDLSELWGGHFDTTTGAKQIPDSYVRICAALSAAPRDVLFISDVAGELAAAETAGIQVLLADRPGNKPVDESRFARVASFETLHITGG